MSRMSKTNHEGCCKFSEVDAVFCQNSAGRVKTFVVRQLFTLKSFHSKPSNTFTAKTFLWLIYSSQMVIAVCPRVTSTCPKLIQASARAVQV